MAFRLGNVDGRAVLVHDGVYDIADLTNGELGPDPADVIGRHAELHGLTADLRAIDASRPAADVVFGPPIPRPRHVFGVGLNYRTHAAETGATVPASPLVFTKFPGCLVGPTADIVVVSDTTDYEAELVVVIGARCKDVDVADAWDVVAGVTVGQDVSDRTLQGTGAPPQFSLGKSHDTYGPTGPWIVSSDLLPDRDALAIRGTVDGEVRQEDTTASLIFDVAELVGYLSGVLTLHPGDLIFTGTPAGVAMATGEGYLRPGQVLETTIEGVGTMTNTCR